MSDKLYEAEKWLPSELLTDDDEDIIMDNYGVLGSSHLHFKPNFGNHFNSFSSSTGLISSPDDLLCNELTRVLTQKKGLMLPVSSLESTLTQMSICSDRSNGLNEKSQIRPFQMSSTRPVGGNDDAWDLIFRASMVKNNAGCGGVTFSRNQNILGPPRSFFTPPPLKSTCPSTFCHGQVLTPVECGRASLGIWNGSGSERVYERRVGDPNLVAGGFESWSSARGNFEVGVKKQQGIREEFRARGGLGLGDGYGYGFGSDIGVRGLKSERVGTGVFLPRNFGTNVSSNALDTLNSQKKPGGYSAKRSSKGINKPSDIAKGASQLQFGRGMTSDNADAFLARKAALLSLQRSGSPRA